MWMSWVCEVGVASVFLSYVRPYLSPSLRPSWAIRSPLRAIFDILGRCSDLRGEGSRPLQGTGELCRAILQDIVKRFLNEFKKPFFKMISNNFF